MNIQREKEFVSQYHFDARNFEWEKENGTPETKVDVNFQLVKRDVEAHTTSLIVILTFMIVFENFVISGTISQANHIHGRLIEEPSEFDHDEVEVLIMKLAVITDSSAYLPASLLESENLFVLDIPVVIDGESYVEGRNLTASEFYEKMAQSDELPKTSQPSIADLEEILTILDGKDYTHVLGLFLSSGISGFYQNIQYLKDEFHGLQIAFPDSKITSAPLGIMVQSALEWAEEGLDFETILANVQKQIDGTSAFIMVDDLDHLVKGGRLSNGAAILGNLLSIKPILYFNNHGVIEVFEKIRTEKKATKRMLELVQERTAGGVYQIMVIHGNAPKKAAELQKNLLDSGIASEVPIATFGSVIGTHLGKGSVALAYIPVI